MTALPESYSTAGSLSWPKALLQHMGSMLCMESRGVLLLQVGIASSCLWWTCKMLWPSQIHSTLYGLEYRMGSCSSRAPRLEARDAASQQTPVVREERRQEVGGKDGMRGSCSRLSSPNKKKSDHAVWFCIVFVLERVQHVCVRKGADGFWVEMNYERQTAGSGFWKGFEEKEKTLSSKNSVNIIKTHSSWYSHRVLFSDVSEKKRNFGSFRFCCFLVIRLIYINLVFWFCLLHVNSLLWCLKTRNFELIIMICSCCINQNF